MDQKSETKYKLAVWFAIGGDKRFLSHRDTIRFWHRALVRARVPVVYSKGFNPHIRFSMPLPRSVGTAGACELMLVEVPWQSDLTGWTEALAGTLPEEIALLGLQWIACPIDVQPLWADYRIGFDPAAADELAVKVAAFEQAERWPVSRPKRGKHLARTIDLKEQVARLRLEAGAVCCRVLPGSSATVRIDELMAALGYDTERLPLRIDRVGVGWRPPLDRAPAVEVIRDE